MARGLRSSLQAPLHDGALTMSEIDYRKAKKKAGERYDYTAGSLKLRNEPEGYYYVSKRDPRVSLPRLKFLERD